MEPQIWVISYLIGINVISFLLMAIDKRRAVRHKWRIPEKTLFLAALLGGSPGSLLGMYLCRHKTRHMSFVVGMPLILLVETGLLAVIYLFH